MVRVPDWRANQGGAFQGYDPVEDQRQQAALQQQRMQIERARQEQARQQTLSDYLSTAIKGQGGQVPGFAGGQIDIPGIQRGYALKQLEMGDVSGLQTLGQLDEAQRTKAAERAQMLGPLAKEAKKIPYEQRRPWINQTFQRLGLDPAEAGDFDPTDAALDDFMASARVYGWEDEAGPKPTALQGNIEYLRKLNPNLTDAQLAEIAQRGITGYQYSDEGIAAQGQAAEARARAQARYRAPSRSGGGAGGGQYEYRIGPNGQLQRRRIN